MTKYCLNTKYNFTIWFFLFRCEISFIYNKIQKDLTCYGVLKYLDDIWDVIYMRLQKYHQAVGVLILYQGQRLNLHLRLVELSFYNQLKLHHLYLNFKWLRIVYVDRSVFFYFEYTTVRNWCSIHNPKYIRKILQHTIYSWGF